MTISAVAAIRSALPLRIDEVSYSDPVLGLSGDGWWLSLMCPWLVTGPDLRYSWDSDTVEDDAWDLVGHSIVAVSFAEDVTVDPVFEIEGGISLAVRADSDWDPWTMQVPGLVVIGKKGSGAPLTER